MANLRHIYYVQALFKMYCTWLKIAQEYKKIFVVDGRVMFTLYMTPRPTKRETEIGNRVPQEMAFWFLKSPIRNMTNQSTYTDYQYVTLYLGNILQQKSYHQFQYRREILFFVAD